ncbi:helix-turn-helix domain-containing protein [Caldibacillus debilis]|uniref:Putative transcriptional regulator n=1 Tax=Caldibacillus debilis GB1 TaxID=1339248 RepID=A0A420VED0_9BACI|nr:helix-turn-helix transcriptional regulator [Caldibacillus debilis]RKO61713.1 putative transcriptional regulator [Caldibacillus debilis GB1]
MLLPLEKLDIQRLLRNERQRRFMTYTDVANGVGVSSSYIFRLEKGMRKKPSYEILARIVDFFDLDYQDLMNYIEGEIPSEIQKDPQKDLLDYARSMDTKNMDQVNQLLELVRAYQKKAEEVTLP